MLVLLAIGLSGCIEEDKDTGQDFNLWEKTYDGNGWSDEARSVATDANGNVYVAGYGTNLKDLQERIGGLKS